MDFFYSFIAAVTSASSITVAICIFIAAVILTVMHRFAVQLYFKRFIKNPKDIVIPKDIDKALEEKADTSDAEVEKLSVNFDSADDVSDGCKFSGAVICKYQGEDILEFAEIENEDGTKQIFTFEAALPVSAICFQSADETNKFLGSLFKDSQDDIDFIVTDYAVYTAK